MSKPTTPAQPESTKRYTLSVVVRKHDEQGNLEHEATATSHNLTLDETKDMQAPLLKVLEAWVAKDVE